MKTFTLLFLSAFICVVAMAQGNWERISAVNITGDIDNIMFADENTGYLTAGSLFKTTDGGTSWTELTTPGTHPHSLSVIDVNTIFYGENGGMICKSIDGGATWTEFTVGTGPMYGLHFPSSTVGYGACNDGNIYKTIDSGLNWTTLSTGGAGSQWHKSIYFIDEEKGCVANTTGVYRTTDGGDTWEYINNSGSSVKLFLYDAGHCYISGISDGYYESNNGGTSWSWIDIASASNAKLYDIEFLDVDNGISVGANGTIVTTTDGGANWSGGSTYVSDDDLKCIEYISSTLGFAGGQLGTLLKYSGGAGVGELNALSVGNITNFPNPCDQSTVIEYSLNTNSNVVIELFDITGTKMTTLIQGKQLKGTHTLTMKTSGLASGMYLYSIKTSEISITKRLKVIHR